MSTLKKILHVLILPCSKATFLIEKRMHSPLSFSEKTQLNAHLILCKWCMAYEKKAQFLHQALQNMIRKKEPEVSIYNIDNKQLKEEVLKKIKK
ncbi:hypothetical protein HZQ11_14620 [Elizabethkingia anophelis]|uniref:hypothetical protein n=1 Tax=Elizabethkingia TaxID=308865 RepID=UPI00073989F7|nr:MULTISPECIES: hypothetical protein [Elizabethkingia]KUF46101.1 hypothetical protein AS358_03970 [Elizabethkingia anophelis]KUG12462.1 hypothetical protein AMC91_07840 [Elizabethkingia miricola]MCL1657455.1 hypothetical protein [Elizabethkingia miricola]MCL1678639.1 hypothetical protein [Elizabethkingia miricola]MCT3645365.1 hypothetical protein [Elizabethkingia anophelis]